MSVAELSPDPTYTLGERIRRARKDAGLQQEDLARLVGVSRPQVSKWERNCAVPDLIEARRIAEVTRHSLGWLADIQSQIRWSSDSPGLTSVNTGVVDAFQPSLAFRPALSLLPS